MNAENIAIPDLIGRRVRVANSIARGVVAGNDGAIPLVLLDTGNVFPIAKHLLTVVTGGNENET